MVAYSVAVDPIQDATTEFLRILSHGLLFVMAMSYLGLAWNMNHVRVLQTENDPRKRIKKWIQKALTMRAFLIPYSASSCKESWIEENHTNWNEEPKDTPDDVKSFFVFWIKKIHR